MRCPNCNNRAIIRAGDSWRCPKCGSSGRIVLKDDHGTPRRGGYGEVWMNDPGMRFRCGNKSIGLMRTSGGGVAFNTMEHVGPVPDYKRTHILTEEQFIVLYKILRGNCKLDLLDPVLEADIREELDED